jgi:hypothetical protein
LSHNHRVTKHLDIWSKMVRNYRIPSFFNIFFILFFYHQGKLRQFKVRHAKTSHSWQVFVLFYYSITLHWRLPLLYIAGLSTQVFLPRIFNINTNRHINNKRNFISPLMCTINRLTNLSEKHISMHTSPKLIQIIFIMTLQIYMPNYVTWEWFIVHNT